MKTIKFVLTFIVCCSFMSCNDTEESTPKYGSDLKGTWKLFKSSGGIAGTVITYPEGSNVWTFDSSNNTLNVVSTTEGPLPAGNYNYGFISSDVPDLCPLTLQIDGMDFGCYSISDGILSINQGYSDGLNHQFVK